MSTISTTSNTTDADIPAAPTLSTLITPQAEGNDTASSNGSVYSGSEDGSQCSTPPSEISEDDEGGPVFILALQPAGTIDEILGTLQLQAIVANLGPDEPSLGEAMGLQAFFTADQGQAIPSHEEN